MQSTQKAKHPEDLQKMIREMYSVHTNPNSPQTGKKTGDKSFRKKELIKLKMGEFMQDAKFKKYIRRIDKSLKDELRMSIVNNALLDFLLDKAYCLPYNELSRKTKVSCRGATIWESSRNQLYFYHFKRDSVPGFKISKKVKFLVKNTLCMLMRWYQVKYIPDFTYYKALSLKGNPDTEHLLTKTDFGKVWKRKESTTHHEYNLTNDGSKLYDFTKTRRDGTPNAHRIKGQADLENEVYCNFLKSWEIDPNVPCNINPTTYYTSDITPEKPCQDKHQCVMGFLPPEVLKYNFLQHSPTTKNDSGPSWYPFRRGVSEGSDQDIQLRDSLRFLLQQKQLELPEGKDIHNKVRKLSRKLKVTIELISPNPEIHPVGDLGKKPSPDGQPYVFVYLNTNWAEPILFTKIGTRQVEGVLQPDHEIVKLYLDRENAPDLHIPPSRKTVKTSSTTTSKTEIDAKKPSQTIYCHSNPYDNLQELPVVELGSGTDTYRLLLGNVYTQASGVEVRNLYQTESPFAVQALCEGDPQSGIVNISWCQSISTQSAGGNLSQYSQISSPVYKALQDVLSN